MTAAGIRTLGERLSYGLEADEITAGEAAAVIRRSSRTIRGWIALGKLPARYVQLERRAFWAIRYEALIALQAQQLAPAPAAAFTHSCPHCGVGVTLGLLHHGVYRLEDGRGRRHECGVTP